MADERSIHGFPALFLRWFEERGWELRRHQIEMVECAEKNLDALLIAPTGSGKTLAGFLPTLLELRVSRKKRLLHTLYVSPLKALAVDVARNLTQPVVQMDLPISVGIRTGDTSAAVRARQRRFPPDILVVTPEQAALLLASPDARTLFADLRRIVIDEVHALAGSKRGDLLALNLARLRAISPQATVAGLSATVRDPDELLRYISGGRAAHVPAALVLADQGAKPELKLADATVRLPWSGHGSSHAVFEIYECIRNATTVLIFVNTRSQAEALFQQLWHINDDGLAIALHHGSLDSRQRKRVEKAIVDGTIRAVVCTSTLDLGVDWGAVDLVINVGAPKGASRLMQRIGRSNHRLDAPSRALLIPCNRFEALECRAAIEAVSQNAQDAEHFHVGVLDVLCQHIIGVACSESFDPDKLFGEVVSTQPYKRLSRRDFDDALAFASTGGYSLRAYDRFAKIRKGKNGHWRIANQRIAQAYRMNVGTIVEAEMLSVRLVPGRRISTKTSARNGGSLAQAKIGPTFRLASSPEQPRRYTGQVRRNGRILGKIEESFVEMLAHGDTFLFAGEILGLEAVIGDEALATRRSGDAPKVPSYQGGKFPLSTFLAERVRRLISNRASWRELPDQIREWLEAQAARSVAPGSNNLLVETFPRGGKFYLAAYPFEGQLAHRTLCMLLTRRMERAKLHPLGFVVNDYALAIWALSDIGAESARNGSLLDELFSSDMLGDDLEEWLQETALMKRAFRNCAIISGLIERNAPGARKAGRQVTISTDLIYDVLRRHEPDHLLLRAARADAVSGLLDLERLSDMLRRIHKRITHMNLDRVSPLAVPIMLEIGREAIEGDARELILRRVADKLVAEATVEMNAAP